MKTELKKTKGFLMFLFWSVLLFGTSPLKSIHNSSFECIDLHRPPLEGLFHRSQEKLLTCEASSPVPATSLAAPAHGKSLSVQLPFFFSAYASNKLLFQRRRHMCVSHTLE